MDKSFRQDLPRVMMSDRVPAEETNGALVAEFAALFPKVSRSLISGMVWSSPSSLVGFADNGGPATKVLRQLHGFLGEGRFVSRSQTEGLARILGDMYVKRKYSGSRCNN